MKILITGATGFVGSHLCDELVKAGHEVYGLVRSQKKAQDFNLTAHLILGDLKKDSITSWVSQLPNDIDCVIHTAGIVHAYQTQDFFDINTQATLNLFSALKNHITSAHFIFVSSLAAHGPSKLGEVPSDHDQLKDLPVSIYGQSKKMAEEQLRRMIEQSSWRLNIIRPPMIIGPRDPAVLDLFKMVRDRFVLYPGLNAGLKQYSVVCVFDLVSMIYQLIHNQDVTQQVFYCAHPRIITYRELVNTIASTLKKKIWIIPIPLIIIKLLTLIFKMISYLTYLPIRLTPDKLHEIKADAWTCNAHNAQKFLSTNYKWDLIRTVEVTAKDYQKRGWL